MELAENRPATTGSVHLISMLKRVTMLPKSGNLLGFLDEEPKAE